MWANDGLAVELDQFFKYLCPFPTGADGGSGGPHVNVAWLHTSAWSQQVAPHCVSLESQGLGIKPGAAWLNFGSACCGFASANRW